MLQKTTLTIVGTVVISSVYLHAADVLYISSEGKSNQAAQNIETVTQFYGLSERRFDVRAKEETQKIISAIRDPGTLAVVIAPQALPILDRDQLIDAARGNVARRVPILITGIDEQISSELLARWSNGSVIRCSTKSVEAGQVLYQMQKVPEITRQLSGSELLAGNTEIRYFTTTGSSASIIEALWRGEPLPTFVRARVRNSEIFLSTLQSTTKVDSVASPYEAPAMFARLAAEFTFMRYVGGDFIWHTPGAYANMTIDDAWLRQPYGHVDYDGLLQEMERFNFHTTIAFIPWNFDRSEAKVVSLFRSHPDRFSVCIHGNNHDHKEFDDYADKSINVQTDNVKQSLARMAKFRELTGISYDDVMVFPHSIAPEQTLASLKRYNFLATVNSVNVPMDATAPKNAEFLLRPATLEFANFPSVRRFSAESPIPQSQLAIDAFLGNPMFFYVHQGFFASGIDAFDPVATRVNRLDPTVRWCGLGEMAEHLYLTKLRSDGNYDVRAYTSAVRVENPRPRAIEVFFQKDEDFRMPVSVSIDGEPRPYERIGNRLGMQFVVPAQGSAKVVITYANDLNLAGVDISKRSVRVLALRQLSDFRDNFVSKSAVGRDFIRLYTNNEGLWNNAIAAAAALLMLAAAVYVIRRWLRRLHNGATPMLYNRAP